MTILSDNDMAELHDNVLVSINKAQKELSLIKRLFDDYDIDASKDIDDRIKYLEELKVELLHKIETFNQGE
jgi:hypothetical protein